MLRRYHTSKAALSAAIVKQRIREMDAKTKPPLLMDLHGRQHKYLRISLTEKCNLRCTYCMPEEGVDLQPAEKLLTSQGTPAYIEIILTAFDCGVEKIRLTGGEPTIRKDFVDIVSALSGLKSRGLQTIGVTTNGIALRRKLLPLKNAGLDQINISLDTLDPFKFTLMTRRNGHEAVLNSLYSAVDLGFSSVKLNMVVINGVNHKEVVDFVNLTKDLPITVRFIEYMPFDGNKWNTQKFIPFKDLFQSIQTVYPTIEKVPDSLNDTTKAYQIPGFKGKIGFITSMSDHFCGTCDRLRILADGNMKVCLFGNTEVSLRDLIRSGIGQDELVQIIDAAVKRKKKQHAGMNELSKLPNRPMILIGG